MSKGLSMVAVSGLLLIMLTLWWFSQGLEFDSVDIIITLAVVIIIVAFIVEGIKKIRDSKERIPIEDEMSKRAQYKAGYYSYLISVYIWLGIYFIRDWFAESEYLISTGIISMAAVFIIARLILRNRGDV